MSYVSSSEGLAVCIPWVVSIVSIAIGTVWWGASVYVGLLRWKMKAQLLAEQDALVLGTVCDIAKSEKSDVVPERSRPRVAVKVKRCSLRGERKASHQRRTAPWRKEYLLAPVLNRPSPVC